MKLHTTKNRETNIAGETASFSITMNSKAFGILLDGLYTHKERAVIRELWTNAFDSHIEAGIESVPFDVHLPTRLDPTFRVRDYGVSMTHEQIMGLYTTVFDSTKDAADVAVGAFGLGSKSPFAYTDSFTVIARLDGRKRTYLASMGEDGVPTITLMADIEADEAQGIEIKMAVNALDIDTFIREATHVAVGFDPRPNIDGAEINCASPALVADDKTWAVFRRGDLPGDAGVYVRQGCVIYPVDDSTYHAQAGQVVQRWRGSLVLNVPIGTVDIAPSREAIQLTARTKATIQDAMTWVTASVQEHVDREVKALPNRRAAIEWAAEAGRHELLAVSPKWRGEPIPTHYELKGGSRWEPLSMREGNSKKVRRLTAVNPRWATGATFVIRRSDRKAKREMIRYREFVSRKGRVSVILLTDPTKKQIERLMHLAGVKREQFVWIGSLPDPGPVKRDRKPSGELRGVYQWKRSNWDPYVTITELPKGPFYVRTIERISKDAAQSWMRNPTVRSAVNYGFDVEDRPIILMTETAAKRYADKHNAPDLVDAADAFLKGKVGGMEDRLLGSIAYEELGEYGSLFAAELGMKENAITSMHDAYTLRDKMDASFDKKEKDLKAKCEKIKKRYPLLWVRDPRYSYRGPSVDEEALVKFYVEKINEADQA